MWMRNDICFIDLDHCLHFSCTFEHPQCIKAPPLCVVDGTLKNINNVFGWEKVLILKVGGKQHEKSCQRVIKKIVQCQVIITE